MRELDRQKSRRRLRATLWARETLPRRFQAAGPAIVMEDGATLWVPPGWTVRIHRSGALLAERGR